MSTKSTVFRGRDTNEYGYKVINSLADKARFAPKRESDEYLGEICWCTVGKSSELGFCDDVLYRRKVDPGDGYEILNEGTALQAGDEFTCDGLGWYPCSFPLKTDQSAVRKANGDAVAFRRKRVKAVGEGVWISYHEQSPERSREWWLTDGEFVWHNGQQGIRPASHWMYRDEAPAPPPKRDSCEDGVRRMIKKHTEWDSLNMTVAALAYRQCWQDRDAIENRLLADLDAPLEGER